jgi:hypothetical protein
MRMLGEVSMAIRNLHARAFDPGKGKRPSGAARLSDDEPNLIPVLDDIRQRVCDLQLIVRTLERNAAARVVETDAATGGGGGSDPAGRYSGGGEVGRSERAGSASRARRPSAVGRSNSQSGGQSGGLSSGLSVMRSGVSVMSLGSVRSSAKGDLPPPR